MRSHELKPRLREGIDITKAGLTVEEGFIVSRLDGHTKVSDIASMVGKPPEAVEKILRRLSKAGVIWMGDEPKTQEAPSPTAVVTRDYGNYIFSPGPMMEESDLTVDERKRILFFFEHLDTWNHYELLQVKRRDSAKEIKRAYFLRSKEWHPDRFRKPNLGTFKSRIDKIFKQIQVAYHTLSDEKKRAEYDEDCVFMVDEDEISKMLGLQRKEEREKRRAEEAVERRKKRNPIRQRIAKAKQFYEEALELESQGNMLQALRAAQTAQTYGSKPEYEEAVERLKIAAGQHKVGPLMRKGAHQEHMTNWDNAIIAFREAVRLSPDNGEAHLRLSYNMLMARRPAQEINPHVQKAISLLPKEPEAHYILGLVYEMGGMQKAAVRALTTALELRPTYVEAKKKLKKLKWGF